MHSPSVATLQLREAELLLDVARRLCQQASKPRVKSLRTSSHSSALVRRLETTRQALVAKIERGPVVAGRLVNAVASLFTCC
jgi:hypothetical protein